ncbi:F0F1 ATP synthase subunit B [Porcipelethomonas sp.]|uniref:F0F1 ATP synthase subunit B n=1 Tax=Porcipelethomonas sp. TaxID=2981675 RepID=UPI003EF218DC
MLEFLSIDIGTIIFTLCNLLILFLVFKHFLFGRVYKILDERQNDVSETYNKADEALEHAKSLESEYSGLMEGAKEESAQMIKAASKKAQMRSDEIISEAKSEASAILARADEDVEREKKRAQNELRGEVSELAVLVAQKVVEKEITEADHERFINEFIDNVGDLK